jgi:CheY-like chemotaxis protein
LDTLGYTTAVAHDGFAAIAAVKSTRPDLVLLDIGLPGMDGYQVAKQLRAELVEPPTLIAVTGYGQASDRGNSLDAGFHSHLVKPVDVARLEQLLQELLPLQGDGKQ